MTTTVTTTAATTAGTRPALADGRPWPDLLPPPPRLQLSHTPGWRFETFDMHDPSLVVFDSESDAFGLSFSLDVFSDGTLSNGLSPDGCEMYADMTPDELADLANETDRLQTWLDDCAEALDWTRRHIKEIIGTCL
ncbi:hypothetical protein [Bifidobacterium leontopitheci]|uniref:Uncharacterized protein n=1 Tax=Bifidobacterium leontopitheci TaxID=2650774 RepID=A0A6I1GFZ7_9BIFI|nr:hypothetical protein [Bifidobacterium leontopitheci]KAB7790560.1 hypothetical protein F7D09_0929 [Bifidobacterium leontopitheci]